MFQSGDKVEIVDDNHLIGLSRISKHYKNGEICEVVGEMCGLVSIQVVEHPPYRKIDSILLSSAELKAIRKI